MLKYLDGSWNTSDPVTINVGSAAVPVSKMLSVGDKLWCSCHNTVKIFDTNTLQFQVSKKTICGRFRFLIIVVEEVIVIFKN